MASKILLTDDDEMVLMSLEELLSSEDLDVSTASNGSQALQKLDETKFDLVMLDVVMPGMSGFEVCKAIRERDEYKSTPIIMLTAKSADADREQGLAAGADRFLPKPIDPVKLVEIVKEMLEQA